MNSVMWSSFKVVFVKKNICRSREQCIRSIKKKKHHWETRKSASQMCTKAVLKREAYLVYLSLAISLSPFFYFCASFRIQFNKMEENEWQRLILINSLGIYNHRIIYYASAQYDLLIMGKCPFKKQSSILPNFPN